VRRGGFGNFERVATYSDKAGIGNAKLVGQLYRNNAPGLEVFGIGLIRRPYANISTCCEPFAGVVSLPYSEEAQKGDSNMSIYMLNLVFDASTAPTNATGRFNDYVTGPDPLQISKAWLTPKPNVAAPDPNISADWQLFQEDTGTTFTLQKNDQMQIRVLGLNLPSGIVAHLTTIISRNTPEAKKKINPATHKPYQQFASPFKLTDGGPCCVFDYVTPDYLAPMSPYNSWLQTPAGFQSIALTTPNPPAGLKDVYTVVVALVTGGSGSQQVYSHDPDCNVEC
jgi:hypothetical protein